MEGFVPLFICMGDLHVQAWFEILENLAVQVLIETSFINRCRHRMFHTGRKVVPRNSKPVEIILGKTMIISIKAGHRVFNVNMLSKGDVFKR